MKQIILFGANCGKCKKAEKIIRKVITDFDEPVAFEKSENLELMSAHQVMYLPSILINNKLHFKGIVPSEQQLIKTLTD